MYSEALVWARFADLIGDPDAPRLEVKVAEEFRLSGTTVPHTVREHLHT